MISSTEWLLKKRKLSHLELGCLEKPVPLNFSEERGKIKGSMETNVSFCTFSSFIIRQRMSKKKKKEKLKHSARM